MMTSSVPVNVAVEDAQLDGLAARQLEPTSTGANAYAALTREMLERAGTAAPANQPPHALEIV